MHITKASFLGWVKTHTKLIAGVSAGIVVGAAGAAVVNASIPAANGTIYACYTTNNTGILARVRIIDNSTQTCNTNETAINWNQQGQQGPAGPTGPQGPTGQTGPQGPAGPGQVLSDEAELTIGDSSTPALVEIPDMGIYRINGCSAETGTSLTYVNNTNHDVYFNGTLVSPDGERPTVGYTNRPGSLSYTAGGTTYLATVTAASGGGEMSCHLYAQTVLSQIN